MLASLLVSLKYPAPQESTQALLNNVYSGRQDVHLVGVSAHVKHEELHWLQISWDIGVFGMVDLVKYQPLDIKQDDEHSQGNVRSSFLERINGLKHCVQFLEVPSQRMQEESQS